MDISRFENMNKPRTVIAPLNGVDGGYRISFIGPLNLFSAHMITEAYEQIKDKSSYLVIDVSDAYSPENGSFDTSTVAVVMDINERLKKRGGKVFFSANNHLQKLSGTLNLEKLLEGIVVSLN